MEVVVINLDSRAQRWSGMSRGLSQVGIQPVRFAALDGTRLNGRERAALYSEQLNRLQYHQSLCPGEIACYASHIEVWRRLLDSAASCVAVMEDDVEVLPCFPKVLDVIARLEGEWDMVKLVGRGVEKAAASTPLCEGAALIRYQRVPSLTGAYVLHRRGAEKLLAHRVPFGRPIDVDLRFWWECGLDMWGVQPYPARESASARVSSITGRAKERTVALRCRKLWLQMRYTWSNWQARRASGHPARQGWAAPRSVSHAHDDA